MAISDVIQHDFKIYYEDNGNKYRLPYAFYIQTPKFTWDLPAGVNQQSYIFEMRTQNPVLYSDGVTYKCAYFSSGRVYSSLNFHTITTIGGQALQLATWQGICEIRLRVFTSNGTEYCSHDVIYDDTEYDFEGSSQRRLWGSRNDSLYFCLDAENDNLFNVVDKTSTKINAKISFKKSQDDDLNQEQNYELQISDSPLFGEGLNSKLVLTKDNIQAFDRYIQVDVAFQNERDESKLQPEQIDALKPGVLYFCRSRSFDGFDYSDWSKVDSFKLILNNPPIPKIHGVYYPMSTVKNEHGQAIKQLVDVLGKNSPGDNENSIYQADRSAGQIIIELSVQDDDHDYVSGELSFSMYVTTIEASLLGCLPNQTNEALSYYDEEDQKKLIRARCSESLLMIPTSKLLGENNHIFVTWRTAKEIQNVYKDSVYLYFMVDDGISSSLFINTKPYEVNNKGIGGDSVDIPKLKWWNKGKFSRVLCYPTLPESMLRQLIYSNNGVVVQQIQDNNNNDDKELGCVGGAEGNNPWFTFWDKYESEKGDVGINKITQTQSFTVTNYDKYQNVENGTLGTTVQTIPCEGFVSFCSTCDNLNILKTVVIKSDGKIYDKLEDAYPDNHYDGISYTLGFKCSECNHIYPLNTKYQADLACGVRGATREDYYSFYHGYNSVFDFNADKKLSNDLLLYTFKQFTALEEEWKTTHGEDQPFPCTFVNINKKSSNSNHKEGDFGFISEDVLLNLSPRPDIQPYFKVRPPKTQKIKTAPYIDGAQLNADLKSDYMYGFEPKEGGTNLAGDVTPSDPGDPDMAKLAAQNPWNKMQFMMSDYIRGKKPFEHGGSGYKSAESEPNSGNGSNIEVEEEEAGDGQKFEPKMTTHICFDAEADCVTSIYNDDTNTTTVFSRLAFTFTMKFPFIVKRDDNDRFKTRINDEILISGSLLFDDVELQTCYFPFNDDRSKNSSIWTLFGQEGGYLRKIFGDYIDIPDVASYGDRDAWNWFVNNGTINAVEQTLTFTLYGITDSQLNSIEILQTFNNCYQFFNLKTNIAYQSHRHFYGRVNQEKGILKQGPLTVYSSKDQSITHNYYYYQVSNTEQKYDFEESPLDNTIEQDYNVISSVSKGQPMFTCYKDEVDSNGYHFKYTEQDFKKTGKIFVRRYKVQPCLPFANPGFGPNNTAGHRDWIVVPIDPINKPGRYYKKKVLKARGCNPVLKQINVNVDGVIISEYAYFDSNGDNAKCISHEQSKKNEELNATSSDQPTTYTRLPISKWRNKILPKTCVVFEYVDVLQAIAKNPLEMAQGIAPLNHHCPIHIKGGHFSKIIERYGVYVMGGYDLTSEQKSINNDGYSYEKTFSSMVPVIGSNGTVTSSAVEYTDLVPNNWRPLLINSIFDADESDSKSHNVMIYDKKEDALVKTNVDGMARYKKHWEDKLPSLSDQMAVRELSQYTVEQFNPSFRYEFKIHEKWGYQPVKHVEDYFQKDEDSIYGYNKYIPTNNRLVHDVHEDQWSDFRLSLQILKERYIVSDKSFISVTDDYDKLPYLDYRLTGRNTLELKDYNAGYMAEEDKAYENRPQPVYKENKPFKIGGINRSERASQQFHPYYENKYQYVQGAYIDKMSEYDSTAIFYYLQDQWNTYNRIHWASIQDVNQYGCLYAQEVYPDGTTVLGKPQISMPTLTSIWVEDLSAWCIPYNSGMSDLIDTFNAGLQDGKYYKFFMKLVDKSTFATASQAIQSTVFRISKTAVSPVNIIDSKYDEWTRQLTLTIRFDDSLGRTYDVIGIYYSLGDEVVTGVRYNNWIEGNVSKIKGQIYNLASNKFGDNVPLKSLIITHNLVINLNDFNIRPTECLRFKLMSSLALDRAGLTMPLFSVKMWTNEFLKPIEDRLYFLQGYVADYNYQQIFNAQTQTYEGKWVMAESDKKQRVIGEIQYTQNKLDNINNEFELFCGNNIMFHQSDVDSVESYIKSLNAWNTFYYEIVFNDFFALHQDKTSSYNKVKENNKNLKQYIINRKWIDEQSLTMEFDSFYQTNKMQLLKRYKESNLASFNSWFNKMNATLDFADIRQLYILSYIDEYNRHFKLGEYRQPESFDVDDTVDVDDESTYIVDGGAQIDDNESVVSSSSSEGIVFKDEDIMRFIRQTDREQDFISFCYSGAISDICFDSRFAERARILYKDYNVNTENLFYGAPVSTGTRTFEKWQLDNQALGYDCLSDEYQAFLIEQNKNNVNNVGRNLVYSKFLQKNVEGSTYMFKISSINNELNELIKERKQCLAIKNKLETNHRIRLIKQGYFCNGFENNQPYKENGSINTPFRWRVESRAYEGDLESNTVYDEDGNTTYGYQERFDVYLRFQMDFYDTFDSQNGLPLRDILFTDPDKKTSRLLMGINTAEHVAKTTPTDTAVSQSTVKIPSTLESASAYKSSYEMNTLQYSVLFSIPKVLLPGYANMNSLSNVSDSMSSVITTDMLPINYQDGWMDTIGNDFKSADSFKAIYFWQVAPYNIVDAPVFATQLSPMNIEEKDDDYKSVKFYNLFADKSVLYSSFERANFYTALHKLPYRYEGTISPRPSSVWNLQNSSTYNLSCIEWKNNSQSVAFRVTSPPYDNDWVNVDRIRRGEVQFITDRPREILLNNNSSSSSSLSMDDVLSEGYFDSYNVKVNDEQNNLYVKMQNSYTCVNFNLYPMYEHKYNSGSEELYTYLYCAKINQQICWIISARKPSLQPNSPFENKAFLSMNKSSIKMSGFTSTELLTLDIYSGNETLNGNWLFQSTSSELVSSDRWKAKGASYAMVDVVILPTFINDSSSSSEMEFQQNFFQNANLIFINDNLNNFDTKWIPYSVERNKPFVLKMEDGYLLFSHKKYFNDISNVITISRGFTNDIFGEQNICFPKYSTQSLNDIISNAISFENACVVKVDDLYTMYFNVVFEQNGQYVNYIYKADTVDFDDWYNFQMVNLVKEDREIYNCLQPNVTVTKILNPEYDEANLQGEVLQYINQFDMYISSKEENEMFYTIKRFVSYDGINFNYVATIHDDLDGFYNCYSPFVYQHDEQKILYFTMAIGSSEIIVSLKWDNDTNDWSTQAINNTARLIVEKGNSEMEGLPLGIWSGSSVHYKHPCVIFDVDYGTPTKRIYYNTFDVPYAYYEQQLIPADGMSELTIHTQYLQEYVWEREYIYNDRNDVWIYCDGTQINWRENSFHGLPTNSNIELLWRSSSDYSSEYVAVKINTSSNNIYNTCLSQAEWINYNNVLETEALLSPENKERKSYDDENVAMLQFINEKQLMVEYEQWVVDYNGDRTYANFIMDNKYYSQYLWWKYSGTGIYRYIGWEVMKQYDWNNSEYGLKKGENE